MELKTLKLIAALATTALTGAASAGVAPFSMIGGPIDGVDVSLSVQNSSQNGYDYDFIINNLSGSAVVTGVYFETGWNTKLAGSGTSIGDAALYTSSLNPDVAGWDNSKGSHTVSKFRSRQREGRGYKDYFYDDVAGGIQAGGSQTFAFTTDTNIVSLSDLEQMLGVDGFGIAIRMQNMGGDIYTAAWGLVDAMPASQEQQLNFESDENPQGQEAQVTGAPTPTAALAGMAMLGIVGLRRRRNK